jgi:hypothetical protein
VPSVQRLRSKPVERLLSPIAEFPIVMALSQVARTKSQHNHNSVMRYVTLQLQDQEAWEDAEWIKIQACKLKGKKKHLQYLR